jgi:hypothetical protein
MKIKYNGAQKISHIKAVELIVLGMSISTGRFLQFCHGFTVMRARCARPSPIRVPAVSDGTATSEELNARHLKGVKPLFLPSADLKRNLEGLTFEVPPETPPA